MEALGVAIAVPVGYFLLAILFDHLVHLSTWGRLLTCLLLIGSVGFFGHWFTRRWRAVRLTEDQVALAMERHTPGVNNRLINSLQLARESKNQSPEFEAAIVSENFQSLKRIQVHQAIQMRPAMIRVSVALALIAIGVGFRVLKPDHFNNSTARLIFPFGKIKPYYRTELIVTPGNAQTLPGGDVEIRIQFKGDKPGKPLDPALSKMLYDLDSRQKQFMEHVKAIEKKFKKAYLPTGEITGLISQLNKNLDRLKECPSPEIFRMQEQLVSQLRQKIIVSDHAVSNWVPSVPRQQIVRGRIIHEPAWQTIKKNREKTIRSLRRTRQPAPKEGCESIQPKNLRAF